MVVSSEICQLKNCTFLGCLLLKNMIFTKFFTHQCSFQRFYGVFCLRGIRHNQPIIFKQLYKTIGLYYCVLNCSSCIRVHNDKTFQKINMHKYILTYIHAVPIFYNNYQGYTVINKNRFKISTTTLLSIWDSGPRRPLGGGRVV